MVLLGSFYIGAIFLTYLLAGLGLLYVLGSIPLFVTEYISITVGSIIVLLGLVEIKDFFWYGQGISLMIPARYVKYIEEHAKNLTTWGAIVLGAFVAAVELPCTGGPYLAITTWIAQSNVIPLKALYYLLVYNFIFVLPLIIILLLVYFGTKVQKIKRWKQDYRKWMRLAIGLVLVVLGILLILIAYNKITFTLS